VSIHFAENHFFCTDLSVAEPELDAEESRHALRVLRLTIGDTIMVTDGNGHLLKCAISKENKNNVLLAKLDEYSGEQRLPPVFTLAVSVTKKPAFETMVELCGQLPVKTIIPFISEHSCKQSDYLSKPVKRLEEKLKTALKQSKKKWLTTLERQTDYTNILRMSGEFRATALFEKIETNQDDFDVASIKKAENILVIVGPEGGFSEREIAIAKEKQIPVYSLGENRLRAETAAFASIVQLSALRIVT